MDGIERFYVGMDRVERGWMERPGRSCDGRGAEDGERLKSEANQGKQGFPGRVAAFWKAFSFCAQAEDVEEIGRVKQAGRQADRPNAAVRNRCHAPTGKRAKTGWGGGRRTA